MSEKWLSGVSSEAGILRKAKPTQVQENCDLLIFGYACKIFRDDERAKLIDHGKHLIPWMGDNSLKIDRYDVRATLSDIAQYEAPPGGYTDRMGYLTASEQRAEQLCEEERYFSLYNNEIEEELYQEESSKRSSAHGQFAYNYDKTETLAIESVEEPKDEEPDEVFVPHPNFYVPPDIPVPETMKLHAIIEKTAKFIASQGPQMEILIKAKQSNNPQFEFLNKNNRVNDYYKYVLNAIKNDLYPTDDISKDERPDEVPPASSELQVANESESSSIAIQYPAVPVPTLKYKPSADCSYTQLISKIKGVPLPPTDAESTLALSLDTSKSNTATNVFDIRHYSSSSGPSQNSSDRPYTPPVLATANATVLPKQVQKESNLPRTMTASSKFVLENEKIMASIKSLADGVAVKKISTGLMLAQCYNSDTDSENDDEDENSNGSRSMKLNFPLPPPDLQNIIDKTAAYVLKNGIEFEEILRTKSDTRFSFLSQTDEYHRYYIYKVTGVIYPVSTNTNVNAATTTTTIAPLVKNTTSVNPASKSKSSDPKIASITSVSFSIKSKDESPAFPLKPALPQEPSSDEEDSNTIEPIAAEAVKVSTLPAPKVAIQQSLTDTNKRSIVSNTLASAPFLSNGNSYARPSPTISDAKHSARTDLDLSDASIRDAILELHSSIDEKRDAKRAEDKLKNHLAQAAREKLGMITKEKQLQLERKKKAMAFLNQMKTVPSTTSMCTSPVNNTESIVITECDEHSTQSVQSSRSASLEEIGQRVNGDVKTHSDNDDVMEIIESNTRSRSRSPKRHKRKKSKQRHTKKKSKQRSRSRSRSRSKQHSSHYGSSSNTSHRRRSTSRTRKSSKRSRYD